MPKLTEKRRAGARNPEMKGRIPGRLIPVHAGAGLRSALTSLLGEARTIELVTDRHVAKHWLVQVRSILKRADRTVHTTTLPPGESMKNARTVAHLHDLWFRHRCDRGTPVIALGGGAVGDTVGFAAATFLRGLPLWQVPTTLLAQVDAAIGGKVGINHPRGKNLIGCFYQPAGILIDPEFLTTLPRAEVISGLAEVVKYGVIADPVLFERCEKSIGSWISGRKEVGLDVIKRCVRIKLSVVESDETDSGLRRILNFGHTIGHALERWADYKGIRHGEAVAVGMIGAGYMARARRLFDSGEFDRLLNVCHHLAPVGMRRFPATEILRHLGVDKKRASGRNIWILPRALGRVEITSQVTDREVRRAVAFLNEWMTG